MSTGFVCRSVSTIYIVLSLEGRVSILKISNINQVVSKFNAGDVEGVVKRANMTEYGLASGVFTKDINKALYVSEHLDAGTCFVNM